MNIQIPTQFLHSQILIRESRSQKIQQENFPVMRVKITQVTMKMQVSTYRRWYQIVVGCVCIYTDEFIEFLLIERHERVL